MVSKAVLMSAVVLAAMSGCESREASVTSAADKGEVSVPGARLTWAREGETLTWRVRYEAPNACYSAGPATARLSSPTVDIAAEVAFTDGICAQAITVIPFEGEVTGVAGPFTIAAKVTDQKSGEVVTLSAP